MVFKKKAPSHEKSLAGEGKADSRFAKSGARTPDA
jgi:hypothetical protein